ncbi:DUF2797 domain-containing protein [Bacteroidota bacterium]
MKKTAEINIGGLIFHINEDGYELLKSYLEKIKKQYAHEDEGNEIIEDIEIRIAELFDQKRTDKKQVISLEDVKEVIKILGEPEEFEEGKAEEKGAFEEETSRKKRKRLYRDPESAILGGVSGGLAAYFNIDIVWVRFAFILLLFAQGFGLLLYIAFWIATKPAKTTAQRLEMRGEEVTLTNIERNIKDEHIVEYTGNLKKLKSQGVDPVHYEMILNDHLINLNQLIGQKIKIEFKQEINCIRCGRLTSKSFAQGYCYPCFQTAPETEECLLRPELCKAHEGEARDMDFARENCLIDHYVYLSVTSGIKVGVTRHTQIPTRWIDQGAVKAIKIAKTQNRYQAGIIEVALKTIFSDKTNWRNMLSGKIAGEFDLKNEKEKAWNSLSVDFHDFYLDDDEITELTYPIKSLPQKMISHNLDKHPVIEGILTGIKGQYLIFEEDCVINIRKYGGYKITFSF